MANYISCNYNFNKIAFADQLKKIAITIGWNEQKDEKGRILLQDLGQVARSYDKDVWIKLLVKEKIAPYVCLGFDLNFVISDLRFQNEVENIGKYIKEYTKINKVNIITIRINGKNYSDRKKSEDISETDLDNYKYFDYNIDNTERTVSDMYAEIDKVMEEAHHKKIIIPELC